MRKLLIAHGALGAAVQFEELKKELTGDFEIALLNFEGHGGVPSERPFSIRLFAKNMTDELRRRKWSDAAVFGYSMGGYAALKVAATIPELLGEVVTLGTKFDWNPEIALKETELMQPDKIKEKVPQFAARLAEIHAPLDWTELMHKTAAMMIGLGEHRELEPADFGKIRAKVTLLRGSEDKMVTEEETTAVQKLIAGSIYETVDGWQHPIERIDAAALARKIRKILH